MIEPLTQGGVALVLLYGGGLALVLGIGLLALYRLAIGPLMRGVPSVAPAEGPGDVPRLAPPSRLVYALETSTQALVRLRPSAAGADPGLRYAAVYAAAGIAFGLTATTLLFMFAGIEF